MKKKQLRIGQMGFHEVYIAEKARNIFFSCGVAEILTT